jgi:AcrR family transcriptional regulator
MARADCHRRDRILDAAEHAFGERGFEGASLREIVLAAQVNLATVYYYFRSKNGLMEAVLQRRFGPLRQEQLALLEQARQTTPGKPLPVETVLRALLVPPLQLIIGPTPKRQAIARLVGRIVTEPSPRTQDFLRSQHAEVRAAFLKALQASLPDLPLPDLRWRFEFLSGALAIILCNPRKLQRETRGACNPVDVDQVLAEMIRFFSHGFRAPSANLPL